MASLSLMGLTALSLVSGVVLQDQTLHKRHRHRAQIGGLPQYFHKTEEIYSELKKISDGCDHMEISDLSQGNTKMQVVTFGEKMGGPKKMKVLLYFGEHSRELISPESGLDFARHLCYQNDETKAQVQALLEKTTIRMVPIVNHDGRKLVEDGNYCHRTNGNDVDLNRNWDEHWQYSTALETYPGEKPFSETETQILAKDAKDFEPNVFLTIHSGTLGLFTPWAYCSRDPASMVQTNTSFSKYPVLLQKQKQFTSDVSVRTRVQEMKSLLDEINPKYCRCEAGAAGLELPYLSPGTSMDYMFDKLNVDYSFAFEIYDGNSVGGYKYVERDTAMIQEGSLIRSSCFALHQQATSSLSSDECFLMFNPNAEEQYQGALDNWSRAYLDLFGGLLEIEKKHGMFMKAN